MSPAPISQGLAATIGLRGLILDGELSAGDRISEIRVAERLGVSRTPLRLALAQLAHESLVEPASGGGFAVRSFSRAQVADAIELRGVLEGAAARLAAERSSDPRALGTLMGRVAQLDRVLGPDLGVRDFELYVELNEAFHQELLALAHSAPLADAYARAVALPFASPSAFVALQAELPRSHRTLAAAQAQHHALLAAIEAGDGAAAEALARAHARLALENLDVALASEPARAKLPGANLIALQPAGVSHGR